MLEYAVRDRTTLRDLAAGAEAEPGGDRVELRFTVPLWEYGGEGSWHFVSVPAGLSEDLGEDARARGPRRGFGSVRVRATVGGTSWTTSVFPSKEGTYLLPVKRAVRLAEGLESGDEVGVVLAVLD